MSDDYNRLNDKLVDAFIRYQWNLDHPFPLSEMTKRTMGNFSNLPWEEAYRNDSMFHAKVSSLVAGVIGIIIEWEKEK